VLLRQAHLSVTTTVALFRLLPMTSHDKDAEILILRHQISVGQRHLEATRCVSPKQTGHCRRTAPVTTTPAEPWTADGQRRPATTHFPSGPPISGVW
jgi:hypothetical protein